MRYDIEITCTSYLTLHGRWRENLGVGLWIYRVDFHLLYEGIKLVYPRKGTGCEDFDDTGMNFISKPEWKMNVMGGMM